MTGSNHLTRRLDGLRRFLTSMLLTTLAAAPAVYAGNNDLYEQEIDALRTLHEIALVAGIVTPPPYDKPAELTEYGTNIKLKFVPPVLDAPPPVVVRPNNGACEFRYMASEHELEPVFDYDDIYGFTLELPHDWGRLDDGDSVLSNANPPQIKHYSTGAYVTVRRDNYAFEDDPDPWYPAQKRRVVSGEEILFTNTDDRHDIIDGNYTPQAMEVFPIGKSRLSWEAESKLDIIFDVILDPIWFFAEAKYSAKAAAKLKKQKRFGRVWDDAAFKWAKSLEPSLRHEIFTKVAKHLLALGLDVSAVGLENATGQELGSFPTGAINRQSQGFWVLDEVPPVVRLTHQPEPFEANSLGGELGNRHFDELRDLLEVSDECDRPVAIDSEPRGTRFWPVNQTTNLQWCGRDPGPTSASGGFNETCADIQVRVQDTRPPLLLAPPSVNVISNNSSNDLEIGWPGVFDVADPEIDVSNDAPASFPTGRTPVTWTAVDDSGNAATATQWINVKPSNTVPVADPIGNVAATSFEEERIDLTASDSDVLDGRHDQLFFRIDDTPDHGFFVAPLFPFFIDDHRQQRINPDGTYSSYFTEALAACEDTGAQPDITKILEPVYVTVNDEGVMYVIDSYLHCYSSGDAYTDRRYRIARFVPNADGELEYANQYDIGPSQPGDYGRHLFIDHRGHLWIIPPTATRIIELSADLQELRSVSFNELSEINQVTQTVQDAFDDSNRRVQSVAIDHSDVLYATDGSKLLAYDLNQRDADDPGYYRRLYPVAYVPGPDVDGSAEEPWRSYLSFLGGGYADMVLDSADNLYVSDPVTDRIWKFRAMHLSADRMTIEQTPDLVGWLGKCTENLDPTVLACDTGQQTSIGFSCQDDLCGLGGQSPAGDGHSQFSLVTGIAMSPQDVLYATDTQNYRVQRFTTDGYFAGEAVSQCKGSCFILGDFGFVTNVAVNSNFFYLLDTDNDLTHIFETTPITDIDDQTMSQSQTAFVKYKSNNNYVGPDSFSFVASDGLDQSAPAQVDISVSRNHRAPFATPNLTFSGNEDEDIPLALSGLDPDEDDLDFEIDTPPEHGSISHTNGDFVYTPDPDFFGTDTFTFVATDAPTSVPALTSEPEPVSVEVSPVNDPPVLSAEALDDAGVGFLMRLQALLKDVDLDDSHRVAIDWGNGNVSTSDADVLQGGASDGALRIVAESTYDAPGTYAVKICASDVPSTDALTCDSPDVDATLELPLTVAEMVELRVDMADSLPKTQDPDIPEIEISEPLLDGGDTVTYTLHVLNSPTDTDYQPSATNVQFKVAVPEQLAIDSVSSDVGSCSTSGVDVSCALGDLASNAEAVITVTAHGNGGLIADELVTLQSEATADERVTGDANAGSLQTKLLLNGELDPDGDGVKNADDAFPGDTTEWEDTDGDGIGNNADPDDDGDTLPDSWESRFGLDPLDASDRSADLDGDGLTNEVEFMTGTRPDLDDSDLDGKLDSADNCPVDFNLSQFDSNGDMLGDICDPRSFAAAETVGDADGDTIPDMALLRTAGGETTAYVKSGATDYDIAVTTLLTEPAQAEKLLGVENLGSAARRGLALIYTDGAGGIRSAAHDAWLGTRIADFEVSASGARYVDADVAADAAGGDTLLVLLAADDGRRLVRVFDPADGSAQGEIGFFDTFANMDAVAVASVGPGAVVVLGQDQAGYLHAQARETSGGTVLQDWDVSSVDSLRTELLGLDGGFAIMTTDVDGLSEVSSWSLTSADAASRFQVFDATRTPLGMDDATGIFGNSTVAIAASDTGGDVQIRYFDAASGLESDPIAFLAPNVAPRGLQVVSDIRVGMLASNNDGDVEFEQRDSTSGDELQRLTAQSVQPPSPPPSPGGGSGGSSGGGSGGGATSPWWLLLLGLIWATLHSSRRRRSSCNAGTPACPTSSPPAIRISP